MRGWSCSLSDIPANLRLARMTSLEGVPRRAVVGTDLHVRVAGGSRGLPLSALANGTLMAR
jgi:hypothetical protein